MISDAWAAMGQEAGAEASLEQRRDASIDVKHGPKGENMRCENDAWAAMQWVKRRGQRPRARKERRPASLDNTDLRYVKHGRKVLKVHPPPSCSHFADERGDVEVERRPRFGHVFDPLEGHGVAWSKHLQGNQTV